MDIVEYGKVYYKKAENGLKGVSCDSQYFETQLKRARTVGIKKLTFVLLREIDD